MSELDTMSFFEDLRVCQDSFSYGAQDSILILNYAYLVVAYFWENVASYPKIFQTVVKLSA